MSDEVKLPDVSTDPAASDTKKCTMCGSDIPKVDRKCNYCQAPQYKQQCVVCNKFIPDGANYCNECKSYQDWRRYFGVSQTMLALIVALIAVLTPLLRASSDFLNRHSKTSIAFQGAKVDEIMITAMNTGRSPSLLRGYRLKSSDISALPDVELDLIPDSKVPGDLVPTNSGLTVRLRANGLPTKLSEEQLRQKVKDLKMSVEIDVRETNGDKTIRTEPFPAARMELFILGMFTRETSEEQGPQ